MAEGLTFRPEPKTLSWGRGLVDARPKQALSATSVGCTLGRSPLYSASYLLALSHLFLRV